MEETRAPSVADQLYSAFFALQRAEEQAHAAICRAFGVNPEKSATWHHEDFTYDYYDSSYELTGADPAWAPSMEQVRDTFALGFRQCWINYTDDTEAHYSIFGSQGERKSKSFAPVRET